VPLLLVLATIAVSGRDLWFFSDDWNILADYHRGNLLEPFNGHLSAVPAGIYQALFHTVGLDGYVPYRLVGMAGIAVLGYQVTMLTAERLGPVRRAGLAVGPVVTALAVAAVLWNPTGQMNLLFPFLVNFSLPIAALVAIWRNLDRGGNAEWVASAWLGLALFTSGLGLVALGAVVIELAARRAPLRRWLTLSPGPLLWAAWFVTHREANEVSTDVVAVGAYAARMLLAGTTSLAAGSRFGGVVVAVALVAYVLLATWRWRSLDGRSLGALSAPALFALLTATSRIGTVPEIPPDELRYSWAVAAYLVLAVVVMARPAPLFDVAVPRGVWIASFAIGAAIIATGAARLLPDLEEWNTRVGDSRPGLSAFLLATEAVGPDRIDRARVIPLSYVPVTAGGYLEAVAAVGSPIEGIDPWSLDGDAQRREVADRILVEELPVQVAPADDRCPPTGTEPTGTAWLRVPPGSSVLVVAESQRETLRVAVSRFGDVEVEVAVPPETGPSFVVSIPDDDERAPDASDVPYRLSLSPAVSASICG
jgi:hypothetical protein